MIIYITINLLAIQKYGSKSKITNFKLIAQKSNLGAHDGIALKWRPQDFSNLKIETRSGYGLVRSSLTIHYLSQC